MSGPGPATAAPARAADPAPAATPASAPGLLAKVRVLLPYFAGTRWAFAVAALAAAVAGACESSVGWLMVPLIDGGFRNIPVRWLAELPRPPLWGIPIALIVLFLIRGAAGFVVDYLLAWASNRATLRLRSKLFGRLLDADPKLFAERSASSLMNTVVYEILGGVNQLVGAVQTLMKDSFTVAFLLGNLLLMNWRLTLFIAAIGPALGYTMRVFGRRMRRITKESQVAVDRLGYVVEENVMAWRMVRLHGGQAVQRERFEHASAALRRLLMKSTIAGATVSPITQLLTVSAIAAIIAFALWQTPTGGMGIFIGFITTAIAVATPLRRLTDVSAPIARGIASVERGLELIEHAPAETGGRHRPPPPGRARGEFTMRGVTVRFGAAGAPAVDGLDLSIRGGETVALVGPSGAGKSTLVNLLPRFLDPTAGEIALDGVALRDWDLHALREQFAFVGQEVVLFNDTVEANVCLGAAVDRGRARAALAAANLATFVDALPAGIETVVGHNGTQLSGGQRQRLAIARAVYKEAPVLILDEATSALDSESEHLVQQALEGLMRGRTSIVIAHRLSTIERADRIIAMDAGRVVEQGRHAELLARRGLYARLHALQFRS